MAAQDLIPALQSAVTGFTATADTKQVTIDAKMTSAQTAIDAARVSQAAAKVARDVAQASSNAAYQAVQSARANLAHQDLEALVQTKAGTFVDVFIYDTSKDSDGGAWRQRCTNTGWYQEPLNTTTRGSRREFPAVAVLVADGAGMVIYDGDDPSLPFWGKFLINNPDYISISAMNGIIVVGNNFRPNAQYGGNGLYYYNFIAGFMRIGWNNSSNPCAQPAQSSKLLSGSYEPNFTVVSGSAVRYYIFPNHAVNDVAMTVLPDAPIDPETGLPTPTIALACGVAGSANGGVSIIRHNGSIVNLTAVAAAGGYIGHKVAFDAAGKLYAIHSWAAGQHSTLFVLDTIPTTSQSFAWSGRQYLSGVFPRLSQVTSGGDHYLNEVVVANKTIAVRRQPVDSVLGGFGLMVENPMSMTTGMVASVTKSFNTGWMPGDIKGAFLSDISATALVGGVQLITPAANGDFSSDTGQWSKPTGVTISDGSMNFSAALTGGGCYLTTPNSLLPLNTQVILTYTISNYVSGSIRFSNQGLTHATPYRAENGTFSETFNTGSNGYLYINTTTATLSIDNLLITRADADWCVFAKGLKVNGTITRTAVATGAELVGYSGFSAANYLEQPYNSGLDFGTGDFCVTGWGKRSLTGSGCILISKSPPGGAFGSPYFELQPNGSYITWVGNNASTKLISVSTFSTDWMHIAFVRKSGVASLYVNGKVEASSVNTENYNHSNNDIVRFGTRQDGYFGVANQSMALWRISATAPTADQVQRIYEDEKVLFQENAACTLFGTSDAVTALAQDPDTGLLHVGTSAGRSTFDGLRRVSNTTTAVTTAISAANGMVIEQ